MTSSLVNVRKSLGLGAGGVSDGYENSPCVFSAQDPSPDGSMSARNLSINGGAFYNVNGNLYQLQEDVGSKGIDRLELHIAPEAFHNSEERYDPPKCHPLTRRRILEKLTSWIEEMAQEEFRTFWLYGSAGVGKSAIMQTIAELYHARGLLLASFFFSRTSTTRNNRSRLIPTLSYQLALSSPLLKEHINLTIANDPTIFERSLDVQIQSLLVGPLLEAYERQGSNSNCQLIIIDGLDECSTADDQCYILHGLTEAFRHPPLGISLMIASRPEQRILTAFHCGTLQTRSQRLSLDNHSLLSEAFIDIEVFLRHKFQEIKMSHPLRAYIPPEWPLNSYVGIILEKAAHHFIFVATVIRFVGCPRHRPAPRLQAICDASIKTEETPFAELDTLYSTILACVENIKPVIEVLGMLIFGTTPKSISFISTFLGYTPEEVRGYLMDMSSLIDLDVPDDAELRIFHASFSDFLTDKRRSKQYYIDHGLVHAHLAKLCLQHCDLRRQTELMVSGDVEKLQSTPVSWQNQSYARHSLLHHFVSAVPTRELR
ncbi:unnamed protein product [Cyclocybe aegerita]|uniref:NACHT domain-containing protein n=1 Tax=Cyclocybe aegerita TaxID=1973307 RepID=A0A8S0WXN4_CYCAE|nr:unnamed protein product [Cyclocybe aegerita]